jgi:hypothetical protein
MHAAHMGRLGSYHNPDKVVDEALLYLRKVLLDNYRRHSSGIAGSYMQRSMGWRSKGARMGNCHLVVVEDDLAAVVFPD